MATLTGGANGVDMRAEPFYDPITVGLSNPAVNVMSSSTAIVVTLSNNDTENFTLSGGTVTALERDYTVTSSTVYNGGGVYNYGGGVVTPGQSVPTFTITGASGSSAQVQHDISTNNPSGIFKDLLTGHDTYVGTSTTDYLIGQGGNDTFMGGSGTEFFQPAGGNNTINGGTGADTVVYTGAHTQYQVNISGASATVTTPTGVDSLSNVGQIQFSDGMLYLSGGTSPQAEAYRLYNAAFSRIPDNGGEQYWSNALATGSQTLVSTASLFASSAEFVAKYGALSNDGFITQLYLNVLGRVPDAGGETYWDNYINQGNSRGAVLANFSESAENVALVAPHISHGIFIA